MLDSKSNPKHIVGNRWMIQILLAYGVTREEITKIFKTNPAQHLGLEVKTHEQNDHKSCAPLTDQIDEMRGEAQVSIKAVFINYYAV